MTRETPEIMCNGAKYYSTKQVAKAQQCKDLHFSAPFNAPHGKRKGESATSVKKITMKSDNSILPKEVKSGSLSVVVDRFRYVDRLFIVLLHLSKIWLIFEGKK